jgi:hypothetical protein
MSWKPEVLVSGKWAGNALVFATKEEAEQWGRDLLMRWFVPTDSRAVEVDKPVNYRLIDGRYLSALAEVEPRTGAGSLD